MVRDGHDARLGVEDLVNRGQTVVDVVDRGIDVALERCPRRRHPQDPALTTQQRRTDLLLQARERARDRRLRHELGLRDLGDRDAVRDLLEPAQHLHVHTHEPSA